MENNEIKRYGWHDAQLDQHEDGPYILFSDVESLTKELEQAKENLKNTLKTLKAIDKERDIFEKENEIAKEKLREERIMHKITKDKLLFAHGTELPMKDAEYQLLQKENKRMRDALELIARRTYSGTIHDISITALGKELPNE